jgi:hypothetical protein
MRRDTEDQFVDCIIALERLLAPDSPQLETTFRFQLRGASILSERFGNVTERIQLVKKLYKLRSEVVHGGAAEEDVKQFGPLAEEVLRDIVQWYFRVGVTLGNATEIVTKIDQAMVQGANAAMRD